MSISFVGGDSVVAWFELANPAGTQVDDFAIAFILRASGAEAPDPPPNIPSGWTILPESPRQSASHVTPHLHSYYKKLTSSEPSTFIFGIEEEVEFRMVLGVWRGVDPITPLIDVTAADIGNSSAILTLPGITTTAAGSQLVIGNAYQIDEPPTSIGFTLREDAATCFLYDKSQAAVGATGEIDVVHINATGWKIGFLVGLNPLGADPGFRHNCNSINMEVA